VPVTELRQSNIRYANIFPRLRSIVISPSCVDLWMA
jgi:hypothetical protein